MSTEEGPTSFRDKVRSLGYLSGGRTRTRVTEGREHPETGRPWKTVTDEAGSTTEHNTRDDRVDAIVTPRTVPLPDAFAERMFP